MFDGFYRKLLKEIDEFKLEEGISYLEDIVFLNEMTNIVNETKAEIVMADLVLALNGNVSRIFEDLDYEKLTYYYTLSLANEVAKCNNDKEAMSVFLDMTIKDRDKLVEYINDYTLDAPAYEGVLDKAIKQASSLYNNGSK